MVAGDKGDLVEFLFEAGEDGFYMVEPVADVSGDDEGVGRVVIAGEGLHVLHVGGEVDVEIGKGKYAGHGFCSLG